MLKINQLNSIEDAINTVVCGDARELIPLIPDGFVGLVIQDPPYGNVVDADWDIFDIETFSAIQNLLYPKLNKCASIYTWCGIGEKSQSLIEFFPVLSSLFHFKDLITWKKRRGIGMRKGWLYTREELMWHVKDNKSFIWNEENQYSQEPNQFKEGMSGYKCKSEFKRITNVWTDIPEVLVRKGGFHQTPKPTETLERIISLHSFDDCVVFDPYGGSFATAAICSMLGIKWISCDIDERFCHLGENYIKQRLINGIN